MAWYSWTNHNSYHYIKQIDSMLPCVCSVMNHRGRQNVVRTSVTHSAIASCATFLFLPHFDVICDLLLNRRTATWNLFVKYISSFLCRVWKYCTNLCMDGISNSTHVPSLWILWYISRRSMNCFCSMYIKWRSWILLEISTKLKLAKINPVIQTAVSTIKWIIACTEGQILT